MVVRVVTSSGAIVEWIQYTIIAKPKAIKSCLTLIVRSLIPLLDCENFWTEVQASPVSLVLVGAVKNLEMEDQIAKFVDQKFNVNVDDVLIRPLGNAFSAQLQIM